MSGVPPRCLTSLALAFIATSITPFVIPARNVVTERVSSDGQTDRRDRGREGETGDDRRRPAAQTMATNPVSGIDTIAPAAKARSATLSPASERARSALTRGIAAAHAPIPRPFARKTPSVAKRCGQGAATARSGASLRGALIIWVCPGLQRDWREPGSRFSGLRATNGVLGSRTRGRRIWARPLRGSRSLDFRRGRRRRGRRFRAFRSGSRRRRGRRCAEAPV